MEALTIMEQRPRGVRGRSMVQPGSSGADLLNQLFSDSRQTGGGDATAEGDLTEEEMLALESDVNEVAPAQAGVEAPIASGDLTPEELAAQIEETTGQPLSDEDLNELLINVGKQQAEQARIDEGQSLAGQTKAQVDLAASQGPRGMGVSPRMAPSQTGVNIAETVLPPMGSAAMTALEFLDTKTNAPVRAFGGPYQQGAPLMEALGAGAEQFMSSEVLPTTPTGSELVRRATGMEEGLGSTLAGMAFEGFGDPSAMVPGSMVAKGLSKATRLGRSGKSGEKTLKFLDLVSDVDNFKNIDVPYYYAPESNGIIPNTDFSIGKDGIFGIPMEHRPDHWVYGEPVPWIDIKHGVAKNALLNAKNKGQKITIFTGSDLVAHDDYIEAIPKGSKVIFQVPPTNKPNIANATASEKRLLKAYEKLKKNGIDADIVYPNYRVSINDEYKNTIPEVPHGTAYVSGGPYDEVFDIPNDQIEAWLERGDLKIEPDTGLIVKAKSPDIIVGALRRGPEDANPNIILGRGDDVKKSDGLGKKIERKTAEAIARTGDVLTGGNLDYESALDAYELLNSRQLLFPGSKKYGTLKKQNMKLAKMREEFNLNPVKITGSREALMSVRDLIADQASRVLNAPNSKKLIDKIDGMLAPKRESFSFTDPNDLRVGRKFDLIESRGDDFTLSQIDDLIRNFDELVYTGQGNERQLKAIWGPALKRARARLNLTMKNTPEGKLFVDQKALSAALFQAGKQRSKLVEAISTSGMLAGIFEPTAFLARFLSPQTYMQLLGLTKLPRETMGMMGEAFQSGSMENIRDALAVASREFPDDAERLVRGIIRASAGPSAQSMIGEDKKSRDVPSIVVDDPEQVQMRIRQLENDDSMDNALKAKLISDMNKKGYFEVEVPGQEKKKKKEPTPNIQRLMDSIERSGAF